jgi:hypothetical protein
MTTSAVAAARVAAAPRSRFARTQQARAHHETVRMVRLCSSSSVATHAQAGASAAPPASPSRPLSVRAHSRTVRSPPHDASVAPLGDHATHHTRSCSPRSSGERGSAAVSSRVVVHRVAHDAPRVRAQPASRARRRAPGAHLASAAPAGAASRQGSRRRASGECRVQDENSGARAWCGRARAGATSHPRQLLPYAAAAAAGAAAARQAGRSSSFTPGAARGR